MLGSDWPKIQHGHFYNYWKKFLETSKEVEIKDCNHPNEGGE